MERWILSSNSGHTISDDDDDDNKKIITTTIILTIRRIYEATQFLEVYGCFGENCTAVRRRAKFEAAG
jgi:hypothetical protein